MDKEKDYFPDKAERKSFALCKELFEVVWRCREENDMAGYADALADIQQELDKYSPDIADCGVPTTSAQNVKTIRESRSLEHLNRNMEYIIGFMNFFRSTFSR